MSTTTPTTSPLAKFITVQPLADHDGAAIFAFEVSTFNRRTGVLVNRVRIFPSLLEQVAQDENGVPFRDMDEGYLQQVMLGQTSTQYLMQDNKFKEPTSVESAITFLVAELFNPVLEGQDTLWWESWRSYSVLRSFYQQFESLAPCAELHPIDVQSLLRDRLSVSSLNFTEDVFTIFNLISQMDTSPIPEESV